jgi:spermidine synthase
MNFISFLAALSSLLYELIFAQILTIYLGGTALRYASIVGIYTLFLGLGNLFYGYYLKASKKLFLIVELLIIFFGLGCPLFFLSFTQTPTWALYAAPILIAFLSGLELPLIFELCESKEKEIQALAYDYMGMLVAAILFPVVLLPFGGLKQCVYFSVFCNLILLTFLIFKDLTQRKNPPLESQEGEENSSLRLKIFAFAFVFSFCSMGYELVLAKNIGELTHNEILGQSMSIGFFLAGLGSSTFLLSKRLNRTNSTSLLFNIETLLSAFGSVAIILCLAITTILLIRYPSFSNAFIASLVLQPIVFFIGFLSGFEIPLLLDLLPKTKKNTSLILAISCFGGLFSSFLIPIYLLSKFSPGTIAIILSFTNFLGIIFFIFITKKLFSYKKIFLALIASCSIFFSSHIHNHVEQLFLKAYYLKFKIDEINLSNLKAFWSNGSELGEIQRFRSPYQTLDIVDATVIKSPLILESYTLYLNRQPQFSNSSWKTYHESMTHAAIHLSRKTPKNALILGGGDGIIAGQLLFYPEIEKITLVDIDKKVVDLAKTQDNILKLNHYALFNPKVEVIIQDGLVFAQKNLQKYDSVFVDFPYPFDLETSKLFSVEFYKDLKELISEDGFAIVDAPLWKYLDDQLGNDPLTHRKLIMNTLKAAGFETIFPFGSLESLIYLKKEISYPFFDYKKLPHAISNRSFVNLLPIDIQLPQKADPMWINSRYQPRSFND